MAARKFPEKSTRVSAGGVAPCQGIQASAGPVVVRRLKLRSRSCRAGRLSTSRKTIPRVQVPSLRAFRPALSSVRSAPSSGLLTASPRPKAALSVLAVNAFRDTWSTRSPAGSGGSAVRPWPSRLSLWLAPAVRSSTARLSCALSAAPLASSLACPSMRLRRNFLRSSTLPRSSSGRMLRKGLPTSVMRFSAMLRPSSGGKAERSLFSRSIVHRAGAPAGNKAVGSRAILLFPASKADKRGKAPASSK
mmetsp:Transcript_87409/g.282995  ORF Transcript_87409/g.282995 Transcript_87409/m.282995 type:complete len:248 (+) Transcript_87409:960-1703(+)